MFVVFNHSIGLRNAQVDSCRINLLLVLLIILPRQFKVPLQVVNTLLNHSLLVVEEA